ncbi:MAG: pyridoxal phosphate-dependent aminotransferase [Candidatus Omnitrophica bacterium]|nr:pyridoxal phosphate-dependent aminotransferase [Candidatus Omnitrophota bacterium]
MKEDITTPPLKFAERTRWDLSPNRLSQTLSRLREEGSEVLDLTESNPTRAGIRYPQELLSFLSRSESLRYDPSPRGLGPAREAVASVYRAKGAAVSANQIFLTASTSEAYGFLFKLLCDPADEVLLPQPGYPLLHYLAGLHDVQAAGYRLAYDARWRLDRASFEQALSVKSRAVVAIHPNFPTGSGLTHEEWRWLASGCQARGLAVISDEVFAEYFYPGGADGLPPTLSGQEGILTFALGGLSKFLALPQMKLSWIAVTGPPARTSLACEKLEMIADTFLSVSTPVQQALPHWIGFAGRIQGQLRNRVQANRRRLAQTLAGGPAELLASDGGLSAVLRVPGLAREEEWVVKLLAEDHVLVHPGCLYGFEEAGFLVVSLLAEESVFQEALRRLAGRPAE